MRGKSPVSEGGHPAVHSLWQGISPILLITSLLRFLPFAYAGTKMVRMQVAFLIFASRAFAQITKRTQGPPD